MQLGTDIWNKSITWRSLAAFPTIDVARENVRDFIPNAEDCIVNLGISDTFDFSENTLVANGPYFARDERLSRMFSNISVAPDVRLYVVNDVYVHTGTWFVFDKEGALFRETVPPWVRTHLQQTLQTQYNIECSEKGVTEYIDGTIGVWGRSCFWNYCHWHYDCLASLNILKSIIGENIQYAVGPKIRTMSFFGPSLNAMPIGKQQLRDVDGIVHCRQIVLSSRNLGFVEPCRFLLDTYNQIKCGRDVKSKKYKKIYVARFDAPGRREIVNEHELAEALERVGFEVFVPGRNSYMDQVETFINASLIIGPHGAGLANLGFSSAQAALVEIHPSDYGQPTFTYLAQSKGLRAFCYFVQPREGKGPTASMYVNPNEFINKLTEWDLI